MSTSVLPSQSALPAFGPIRGPLGWAALLLGVVMPVVSALIYPTYMHKMPHPAWELSRLFEMPFVFLEMAIVIYASRQGMDRAGMWRVLPRDMKIAACVLLFGVFASSVFITAKPAFSLAMSLITVLHLMFAQAVVHLVRLHGAKGENQFLALFGVGLGVLAIYTAWWFSFPPPAEEVPGGVIEWRTAIPGFISVRHFGAWTGVIAAAFAVRILYSKPDAPLGWDHAFYCLAAGLTVWSGTRAAILAIVVSVVAIAVMQRRLPSLRDAGVAAMLTGLAMCIAWWLIPPDSAFYLIAPTDGMGAADIAGSRTALWMATYERWLDSPLFGWGSGSTFWEVSIGWTHTQPHNVVLQFLISWGVIGAAGGLWLVGRGLVAAHKAVRANRSQIALLAMLYALMVQSLLEGMLHYPRFIIMIVVLMVILIVGGQQAEQKALPAD